jgi:hypothetical protein
VGSGGNADDGEAAIIPGHGAESRTLDHDIDAGERLSGGAIDYLSGDDPGGLLRAQLTEGCRRAKNGADEQTDKTVG